MLLDDESVIDGAANVGVRNVHAVVLQTLNERHQAVHVELLAPVLFGLGVRRQQRLEAVVVLRLEDGEQLAGAFCEVHTPYSLRVGGIAA